MSGFKVQDKACSTCIYRKDSPLDIDALEEAIADPSQEGSFLSYRVCHHSNDACCRGFWNRHKDAFNMGRIAQRLKAVEFVHHDTLAEEG